MSTPLATKQFVDDAIAAVTRNVIASNVGDITISNDATERDLLALTLPAAKMRAGDVIRWGFWGTLLNNSGSAISLSFRVYLGATKIFDAGTDSGVAANAALRSWLFEGNLFVETLQTQEAHAAHTLSGAGASGTGSMNASSVSTYGVNTGIGVDLSIDQILKITVQFNTAAATIAATGAYAHASAWRA